MKFPIKNKITLIICINSAIILCGIYFYLNSYLKDHTFKRVRTSLIRELNLAKTFIQEKNISGLSIEDTDKIADEIGKDLGVRVTIINMDGKVIGDSDLDGKRLRDLENHKYRAEIQDALKKGFGEKTRFSTTIKTNMLYAAYPFGKEKEEGFIRLSVPLSDVAEVSSRLNHLIGVLLVVAFALSVFLGFLGSVFISNPIEKISSIANSISKGDFSRKIHFRTNDEIEGLGNAINNMSDQIEARIDEILFNKSRFEAVLLNMFDGVMVIDAKDEITLMNNNLRRFFMVSGDFLGKRPIEVIRNIDIEELANKTLQATGEFLSKEISVIPIDKTFDVHSSPVLIDGKISGAVLVFHDISELRRLENIRKDFVANVSHELRTPITNIKGYSETLIDGAYENKNDLKEFLGIISADSNRLAQLVEDLLDLSKIESGKIDLNIKPCDIRAIVDKVISGLKKQIQEKEISIDVNIPKECIRINADEKSIAQVFLNLIDNAIKYNKEKGSVQISLRKLNDVIEAKISDTGLGIPETDLPRIFERFYRVDKARSRDLGGTGLGLSITKHIVQAHKGQIAVDSILSQGTTFVFTLPQV